MFSLRSILPFPILITFLFLSACGVGNLLTTEEVYLPPTLASSPISITTPAQNIPIATSPAPCTNNLRFLQDITIPDGTVVFSGNRLDKRWLVENSGTCNWDREYKLKLIAGPDMGVGTDQSLYPARSGAQVTIQIIYKAPDEPGIYRSAWQAHGPDDQPFGDPIFIEVVVQ